MTTRAELELITRDVELNERLLAAKDAYRAKPTDKTKAALTAIKLEIREHRRYWREIRAAFADPDAPGVATPKPLNVKAKVK